MKSRLLRDCKKQTDKKKREEYIQEQKFLMDLLKSIFEEDLRLLEKEQLNEKRYEENNWSSKQADYNGGKRQLLKVIDLLTIGEPNG